MSWMTERVLRGVAENCDTSEQVVRELLRVQRVAQELGRLERLRRSLSEQFQEDLTEIERAEAAARADCPHPSWTYQADPAGGRDSSNTCDVCGGEA
jgi:hypothetical protein